MARFLTEHSSYLSERQISTLQPSGLDPESTNALDISVENSTPVLVNNMESDSEMGDLSNLLHDQQVTNDALVNHAIDWLLE